MDDPSRETAAAGAARPSGSRPAGLSACALAAFFLLLGCCNGGPGEGRERGAGGSEVVMEAGGSSVILEVAATKQARARGLMYRQELASDRGMLFVYPEPQILSFWMKNTLIPLSIAFVREDGVIVNIEEMRPLLTARNYVSAEPCRFAIEMNAGWFAERGLRPGSRIVLPPEVKAIESE